MWIPTSIIALLFLVHLVTGVTVQKSMVVQYVPLHPTVKPNVTRLIIVRDTVLLNLIP